MDKTFSTGEACAISGLTHVQFQNSVQANSFTAVPEPDGNTRRFTHDDLMFLKVFAVLLRAELPPKAAGKLASSFHDLLKKRNAKKGYWFSSLSAAQKRSDIKLLIGADGTVAPDFSSDRAELQLPGGRPVVMRLVVDIAAMESEISAAIENLTEA